MDNLIHLLRDPIWDGIAAILLIVEFLLTVLVKPLRHRLARSRKLLIIAIVLAALSVALLIAALLLQVEPEISVLGSSSLPDAFFLGGQGLSRFGVGDSLVVYDEFLRDVEVPIALLRVVAVNPDTLTAQAVLIHPDREVRPTLRVDGRVDRLSTSELLPAFDGAVGYALSPTRVRLRPDVHLEVGSVLNVVEPITVDGAIIDYETSQPPASLELTSLSIDGLVGTLATLVGQPPSPGALFQLGSPVAPTATPDTAQPTRQSPTPPTTTVEGPTPTPSIPVSLGTPVPAPPRSVSSLPLCEYATWEWDPEEWLPPHRALADDFGTSVTFDPVPTHNSLALATRNGGLSIFHLDQGILTAAQRAFSVRSAGIAYSPDGDFLIASSVSALLQKWRVTSYGTLRRFQEEPLTPDLQDPPRILAMAYHANDIVLGLDNGELVVSDFGDLLPRQRIPNAHGSHLWSVAFSPDGSYLLTGGADARAYLWHLEAGEIPRAQALVGIVPPRSDGVVSAVAVTTFDNRLLLALGTHNGYLTLHTLDALVVHPDYAIGLGAPIWSLSFSPDGTILAAGTEAGVVHVFRTNDIMAFYDGGPLPASVVLPIVEDYGPDDPTPIVSSLDFSPRGEYLAAGYPTGVSLWAACP
jgi:WD40 repeat protein